MITLGEYAKDEISGIKGIIVAKSFWLFGCKRIVLQQKYDKKKAPEVPEQMHYDVEQIKLIDCLKKSWFKHVSVQNRIKLGDRVEDIPTGITGIVECITYWLGGGIEVNVQPKAFKNRPVESIEFSIGRLEVFEHAVITDTKAKIKVVPNGPKQPGVSSRSRFKR